MEETCPLSHWGLGPGVDPIHSGFCTSSPNPALSPRLVPQRPCLSADWALTNS